MAQSDKYALVFPGQGSQSAGMGLDLLEASPLAARVFEAADDALGYRLSTLCFEGPDDKLRETIYAQPAVFTVSLAYLEAARQLGALPGREPTFVAGHSLGEYTALVASGAIDFPDAIRLVAARARLMQEAAQTNPGTMAAVIGLNQHQVETVCRKTGAQLCNLNALDQIVIGGPIDLVELASIAAKEAGARRVAPLNVSGAFHTNLMAPAAEGLAAAVEAAPISDPAVPIVANGTGVALTTAAEIREELVFQLTHPVQWSQSAAMMGAAGVTTFIEIGPGKVLTGLIKRLLPDATLVNINNAASARGE